LQEELEEGDKTGAGNVMIVDGRVRVTIHLSDIDSPETPTTNTVL
jgi:hypothetical protein